MIKEIKFNNEKISTKIIIKSNFIQKYLTNLLREKNKVYCIVDINVKYLVKNLLNKKNLEFIFIRCGEDIKNINTYNKLCEKLLSKNINRECILVAIGGGTLGDLCGFISSTLLRGIRYTLVPTTLLSQVDSSIGGKNGINSKYGKNMIGSFYHPKEVIIDTKALNSLPLREIKSGYAEMVKHALIKDLNFFIWLEKNYKKLYNLNLKVLEKAIFKSIIIKLYYVKKDVKEKLTNNKSRAMLNLGHSVGHALEAFYNYKKTLNHGEAVTTGIITEAIISNKLGILKDIQLSRILKHFKNAKLKITDKNIKNDKIINIMKKDKKNTNNKVNIVLLKSIGISFYCREIDISKIKKIINNI